jgi:RNA polymerase sigma factor (TIGR02999 family)
VAAGPDDITGLLHAWGAGDREALDRLMPLVYRELRQVAHRQLRDERRDGTIVTTALVNEAYLRLVDQKRARLESRAHFLNLAAQMMRRVLVDEARKRTAGKRGQGRVRFSLDDVAEPAIAPDERLIALDEALSSLAEIEPRLSRIVELRYFAGLSVDQAADALQISASTAARDWQAARAWLYTAMTGAENPG